jgi:hypothetical protein
VRIVWLASYPKSGNTWFRVLIANLNAPGGVPVDINNLPVDQSLASAREPFDHFLLIDSSLLTHEEIDGLRPHLYEELAQQQFAGSASDGIHFAKVHDAYTAVPGGEPLLAGARGAAGAIVIVRDPRDIALSLANHRGTTVDDAITFLNDTNAEFSGELDGLPRQLRQKLLGWSQHVASWLEQCDIPTHLIRYEDLAVDTAGVLHGALSFAGISVTDEAIERAVRFSQFAVLQQQERESGFYEAPRPFRGNVFFRRGQSGGWRDELMSGHVARIEAEHGAMMRRLGYQLETVQKEAAMMRGEAA